MRVLNIGLAVLLSVSAASVASEHPHADGGEGAASSWRSVDAEAGKIRDIEGLEQLARDFPDSGTVRLRLLQPYLAAREFEKVLGTLEWLYDRGYVFGDVAKQQIPKLLEGVDPGRIAERLRADAEVVEASEIVATIPATAGLVESVFASEEDDSLVATSVTRNALHIFDGRDSWMPYSPPNASDLSGIVSDDIEDIGWVASANIDESDDDQELFTGLIGITGEPDEYIFVAAPDGVRLSDLHRGADGTIYASDPLGGGVYAMPSGSRKLDTLVEPGTFRSPQGLTTSADGRTLYVSDYRYGIAMIDLETKSVSRLASEIPAIADGVDGLWHHGRELIAVQNGTSPMRISAFRLSADGKRIVGARVLEQANPEWTEPLSGSIAKGALYYVGNGQWDRFVKGEPAQDKPVLPTQIRRLPLD